MSVAARPCSNATDAVGRYYVCPICFDAKHLDKATLLPDTELAGTVPMWQWIGDDRATTFSYGRGGVGPGAWAGRERSCLDTAEGVAGRLASH